MQSLYSSVYQRNPLIVGYVLFKQTCQKIFLIDIFSWFNNRKMWTLMPELCRLFQDHSGTIYLFLWQHCIIVLLLLFMVHTKCILTFKNICLSRDWQKKMCNLSEMQISKIHLRFVFDMDSNIRLKTYNNVQCISISVYCLWLCKLILIEHIFNELCFGLFVNVKQLVFIYI